MVSHLTPIIAQLHNPKQIEKLRGEGIVEKKIDDKNYIIRFSSGKIDVTLTSGSLSPDTKVKIKEQGNHIIIIPVNPQKNPSDQITLSQKHSENSSIDVIHRLLSIVTQTSSVSVIDQTTEQYKIISDSIAAEINNNPEFFNSNRELNTLGEKIVNTLSKATQNQETISEIKDLIRAFQIMLVELRGEEQKSMVLPQAVESGFSYFTTGKEMIDWIAQTQPLLDKDNLYQLFLSKPEPVIIQTVAGPDGTTVVFYMNRDESLDLINSFIHNDLKSPLWKTLSSELFLSVLKSRGSITKVTMDSIDKILQSLNHNTNIEKIVTSNGSNYLIQQWIAHMLDNPEKLQSISKQFPVDALKNFGSNFENLLLKMFPDIPEQSNTIEDVLTNTVKNSDMPKTEGITQAFNKMGYNLEQTLIQSEHTESTIKQEALNSLKSQLYSLLQHRVASNDNIPFISNTTDNPLLDTLTQIRNLTSRISQLFQSSDFTAIKKPASQWKSVITGIHSLIQNFEDNIHKSISKAEEQFIKNMQAIQQGDMAHETFSKSLKSIADYLSSNITRLFDNILKDIMTDVERSTRDQMKYAQQISSQITSLISQIKQEIVHLMRNIEQNIESYISQGEKNIQSALPENIRQQVETMLSRFESLQLLSKPVPTADGQQQILSFPVKFGEEWTDVKIILNKKKNRKKNKNNQKNFSVRMHVAPSNCGAVSINMDYNLKYKLNVNIEFEKNESRVWFNKHREQMISALKENGIPSVTLSLASGLQSIHCRKKSTIPILPDKDRKNRKIDINV